MASRSSLPQFPALPLHYRLHYLYLHFYAHSQKTRITGCVPDHIPSTHYFVLHVRAVHVTRFQRRDASCFDSVAAVPSAITRASVLATTARTLCYMFRMCANAHFLLFVRAYVNSFNTNLHTHDCSQRTSQTLRTVKIHDVGRVGMYARSCLYDGACSAYLNRWM